MRIALATAIAAYAHDDDLAPLLDAFRRAGAQAEALAWDDPTVSWARFDAVLLRSTWNYCERLPAFLAWCDAVDRQTRLFNPVGIVRWNTDKRYLAELARDGVPVVPSRFIEPGEAADGFDDFEQFVVKPTVGAGARDARRFGRAQAAEAVAHAQRLLDAGRGVMVQPYIDGVDARGETALVFIDGHDSHALRKGALLPPDAPATDRLFAPEQIRPRVASEAEYEVALKALEALPFPTPLYARVDLLPGPNGPLLLELELVEPSLFFASGRGAADRLALATLRRVAEHD